MSLLAFVDALRAEDSGPTARPVYEAALSAATADPIVLGAVLSGSQARDCGTPLSDYDLYIVVEDSVPADLRDALQIHSKWIDLMVMSLDEFRRHALPDDEMHWNAYAFAGARIVLDRAEDGLLAELIAQKTELSMHFAHRRAAAHLDPYTNSVYRSLKNQRDGRPFAARMDAHESLPYLLTEIFALHGRVRPYSKYLEWELKHRPLGEECWSASVLLPRIERIQLDADPQTQRAVFRDVEDLARRHGHGAILDAWDDEALILLRGRV